VIELGRYLVTGRERAGVSAEHVSRTTRIPPRAIAALEEGRWDELPQPVFVRGFVLAYCRVVGLDERPALDLLAGAQRGRREGVSRVSVEARPDEILVGGDRPSPTNWTYLAIVLVFVIGILVAILTVGTNSGNGDVTRAVGPQRVNWNVPVLPSPRR
jgi:cytoskeleton protein RodZ